MKDINFLVEENPFESQMKKEKNSIPTVKIIILTIAIAIGAAILLAPGIYIRILEGRALTIERKLTDAKYNEVRDIKAQLSQVSGRVNGKKAVINAIDAQNIPASQLLLIIKNALPSGCFLNSVNYSGKSLTVKGAAESSFIAMDYLANLERLKLIKTSSQNVSFIETQSAVEFSITCTAQTLGGEKK